MYTVSSQIVQLHYWCRAWWYGAIYGSLYINTLTPVSPRCVLIALSYLSSAERVPKPSWWSCNAKTAIVQVFISICLANMSWILDSSWSAGKGRCPAGCSSLLRLFSTLAAPLLLPSAHRDVMFSAAKGAEGFRRHLDYLIFIYFFWSLQMWSIMTEESRSECVSFKDTFINNQEKRGTWSVRFFFAFHAPWEILTK